MASKLPLIPGAAAIGCGFDAILADATDMGSSDSQPFRSRVVKLPLGSGDIGNPDKGNKWLWEDRNAFWVPTGVALTPGGTTGETHVDGWSSIEKLSSAIAADFGLSTSVGLFHGSAELRCASSVETEVAASSALLDHRGTFWTLRLSDLDLRVEDLSDHFVSAVRDLPEAEADFSPELARRFLDSFGSHLVVDASVGYLLRIFASESSSTATSKDTLMAAIEGSYGRMIETSADVSVESSAMVEFKRSRHIVRAFGGDPTFVPAIEAGSATDFARWLGSTHRQPALRRVGLRSIVDFVRLVDRDRAEHLQRALAKFGLYEMSERLFAYVLPGEQMMLTLGSDVEASRPLCRVFAPTFNAVENLQPVFRFKNPRQPGYGVFGTDRNGKFAASYEFDRTAFRVFATPQNGTVPLYRFETMSVTSFTYSLDPTPPSTSRIRYFPPVQIGHVLPLA